MLPIDLLLVRHGQSEGNAAHHLSSQGDHSAFTPEFKDRHSASLRLTKRGRMQARQAGKFIRTRFCRDGVIFDRYITSEYVRAMETAGLLGLRGAEWLCDFYLTERDWGRLDAYPKNELQERFGDALRIREIEPFFWRPPNGESFAELCLRIDRVLDTLHRECSDKRVIIVCHGEVMRAFQVRLERMSQIRFKEMASSDDDEHVIYNCEILHYTRRNPKTQQLVPYVNWKRTYRPTATPVGDTGWQEIVRLQYSNSDLIDAVSRIPAMVP